MYTFGSGFKKRKAKGKAKNTLFFFAPAALFLFKITDGLSVGGLSVGCADSSRQTDSPETERARTPQTIPTKTNKQKNDIIFVGSKKEDKISPLLRKMGIYFNTSILR